MRIRLEEALSLANYRIDQSNQDSEVKTKRITLQAIGRELKPEATDPHIGVFMNKLKKGKTIQVDLDWIVTISEKLGVDFNFLFGYESVFDEEYSAMLQVA